MCPDMERVIVGQAVYFDHCWQWTYSDGKTVKIFAYNLVVPDAHTLYQLQLQGSFCPEAPTPAPTPPTQAPTPAPAPAPAPTPVTPVRGEPGWQRPNNLAANLPTKDRYC
jgi:hypothetical protein